MPGRSLYITGNGVIEATEVDLSSKVPGRILRLFVDEGDRVHRGELIAILYRTNNAGKSPRQKAIPFPRRRIWAAQVAGSRPQEIQSAQAQYDAAMEQHAPGTGEASAWAIAGSRPEDIGQARAAYQQAQANLSLVLAGPRPEQIAQLRAQYAQAQANLNLLRAGTRVEEIKQAQAALDQAKANATNAETELKRAQYLFDQGAIPGEQLDTTRTQRDVAQAQVRAAQQKLAEAQNRPAPAGNSGGTECRGKCAPTTARG